MLSSATLVALTVPPKSLAPERLIPPDPFTVNAVVPSLVIVLPGAWVISPFEVAANPPDPKSVLPSVSGVLSTTVAPEPLTPTEPLKALLGLSSVTTPSLELTIAVVLPPTFRTPVCEISPVVLARTRLPVVFISPSTKSLASLMVIGPFTEPPVPVPLALTGPTKLFAGELKLIAARSPLAVRVVGPVAVIALPEA